MSDDSYRKGWAVRYLREAKAELIAAKKTPYMAAGFIMEALTKAQAAIYYSIGDPAFIVPIVHESLQSNQNKREPILNFLVEIEKTLHELSQDSKMDIKKSMDRVNYIIEYTSEIVDLFGCESS